MRISEIPLSMAVGWAKRGMMAIMCHGHTSAERMGIAGIGDYNYAIIHSGTLPYDAQMASTGPEIRPVSESVSSSKLLQLPPEVVGNALEDVACDMKKHVCFTAV
jgi:hypothetical protein